MTLSAPPRDDIPKLADVPLEIETARLRLRPIALTDVDEMWPHVSDPRMTPFVTWAAHTDREETRAWIQSTLDAFAKGTDITWVIEHEGRASGCISLNDIRWQFRALRFDRAEIGYWMALALWGQGFMTEAAHAVTAWAFETLGLHKVTIGCIENNIGSRRVIEKVGFRFLCRREDDVWRDGRWYGHLRYELTAAEWGDTTRTLRFNRPA